MSGQDGYEEQFEGDESPAVRGSAGQTASWMTRIWATPFHIFSPLKLPQNLQRTVGLWPIITIDSEGFFFFHCVHIDLGPKASNTCSPLGCN